MDFLRIENEMRYQLCDKLKRPCDKALNDIIYHLMFQVQNITSNLEHVRYGTMEVPNQYYYEIEYEFDDGYIDAKLFYTKNNAFKSYHKIHIKI